MNRTDEGEDPLQRDLAASPRLFPLRILGDEVELLALDEAAYRAVSFLDERLLGEGTEVERRLWRAVRAGAPPVRSTHFIFHIGHCGSTLLSRLLGEHPALFGLREPALLRSFATGELPPAHLAFLLALFSRPWRPEQTAVIKATSFVSEIGADLLQANGGGRVILLGATPPTYLRTILAGPASRQEAVALAASRQARLERRLGARVACRTEGEQIAMSWLSETLSLQSLAALASGRVLWLDFDRLLLEPSSTLRLAITHFGARPEDVDIGALATGPLMTRYAKAPEHAYDKELRRRLLDQAGREHVAEVRRGMDWLQAMAVSHPQVTAALRRVALTARPPLATEPTGL